jgi:hypothetical protein
MKTIDDKEIAEAVLEMGGVVMYVPCDECDEDPCVCTCPNCDSDVPCICWCELCKQIDYPDGLCHCNDECFMCEKNEPNCGCCELPFCGPEFGGKCRCTASGFLPSY